MQARPRQKPGRKPDYHPIEPLTIDLFRETCDHFFPTLNERLGKIKDPRDPTRCTFSVKHLVHLGVMLFMMQMRSRRQLCSVRYIDCFRQNLALLCGESADGRVAHTDTLNYWLRNLPPGELDSVATELTRTLCRSKVLDKYRLDGDLLVAVDGVNVLSNLTKPPSACKWQTSADGTRRYQCDALEAKVVTESGLALHLATEFIEAPTDTFDKQDCELKAFYRLVRHLHHAFPHMRLCLLLDGLFANQTVMALLREYNWSFLITFKEGSVPALYARAMEQCRHHPEQATTYQMEPHSPQQLYWALNLDHLGQTVHAIFAEADDPIRHKHHLFAYLTDHRPNSKNAPTLVNRGGRFRWRIENQGFKDQKRGGFELEHNYGTQGEAWKNFYFLLQIAHTFDQLITHGDLFSKRQRSLDPRANPTTVIAYYGSLKAFRRRLGEQMRCCLFTPHSRDGPDVRHIQIRLDSS